MTLYQANRPICRLLCQAAWKFAGFARKERRNLTAVFVILLLLKYLLTYLTGKAGANSGKFRKPFTGQNNLPEVGLYATFGRESRIQLLTQILPYQTSEITL